MVDNWILSSRGPWLRICPSFWILFVLLIVLVLLLCWDKDLLIFCFFCAFVFVAAWVMFVDLLIFVDLLVFRFFVDLLILVILYLFDDVC